jgi:hypothetical protein
MEWRILLAKPPHARTVVHSPGALWLRTGCLLGVGAWAGAGGEVPLPDGPVERPPQPDM